jgi:hypothetical protein
MTWNPLRFGKHKGKTLPQVLFQDPDWFFYALKKGIFKKGTPLGREAEELNRKARRIRIPRGALSPSKVERKAVAEYTFSHSGVFGVLEIVPASQSLHSGSPTIRREVIDLGIASERCPYDKLGNRLLIRQAKFILFGSSKYRMTRKRCEEFFGDDRNFVI